MTVYLVTSLHRSGSSMMMRCLEAGGLRAVYGHDQDFLNVQYGRVDYQPNPGGFYALDDLSEFNRPDFAQEYEGALVKIPAGLSYQLAVGEYQTIVMRRDPAEILASMTQFTPYEAFTYESAVHFYDLILQALVKRLETAGHVVTVVDYADVLRDPLGTFEVLAKTWPIDAAKAASCVDPKLYRSVMRV